jgi:hypothetical protein
MQARQVKQDKDKRRCDRCQQPSPAIHECCFSFRHPFTYWKEQYQRTTGRRLTLRRHRALGDDIDFDYKHPPAFWMDLCGACWETCRQSWDGFPMTFWETVLLIDTPVCPAARNAVPTKTQKPTRGRVALP